MRSNKKVNIIGLSLLLLFCFHHVELLTLPFYDAFHTPYSNYIPHLLISILLWVGALFLWNKVFIDSISWKTVARQGAVWGIFLWILKNFHFILHYYNRSPENFLERYFSSIIIIELAKVVIISYSVAYIIHYRLQPKKKNKSPDILDD